MELAPAEDPVHKDFVRAVKQGQRERRLSHLLSQGANVDAKDNLGLTALYYAAFRGDLDNVGYLINHGADLNVEHNIFGTPIAIAALRRRAAVVKTLLQHGADHSRFLAHLGSALHCACFGGDIDVFKSIVHEVHLATQRKVRLEAFSELFGTNSKPAILDRILENEQYYKDLQISCSPVFLAAERCQFDILQLCWHEYNDHYFTHSHWDLADEQKADHNERPQSRIKTSFTSLESRSGLSNVSKASTSSAMSWLKVSSARETMRPTLLMWAAASLNLRLIDHLLEVGASANATDEGGKTALHYAAAPFKDAAFDKTKECVRLLLANQASSAVPTIQIMRKQSLTGPIKSPLDLVVSAEHAALDRQTRRDWGSDIHQTVISSFLDPLPTEDQKAVLARKALLHALSHDKCPADSIKLLCKHVVKPCRDSDSMSISQCMDESLHNALQCSAAESVISILLDHGADPNALVPHRQLRTAIYCKASTSVVKMLLAYGADPCVEFEVPGGPRMTSLEYAKTRNRPDLIQLFQTEHLPKLTPTHPAPLMATEQSDRAPWTSRTQDMPTATKALNEALELDEADELDDLNEFITDGLTTQSTNPPKDSVRLWLPAIPSFPLSRLRRNSKQK